MGVSDDHIYCPGCGEAISSEAGHLTMQMLLEGGKYTWCNKLEMMFYIAVAPDIKYEDLDQAEVKH